MAAKDNASTHAPASAVPLKKGVKASLADSSSRGLVLFLVAMVLIAGGSAFALFTIGSDGGSQKPSQVTAAPQIEASAGGAEDPQMTGLLIAEDQRRAAAARDKGNSMFATLTAQAQPDAGMMLPPARQAPPPPPTVMPVRPLNVPSGAERRQPRQQQAEQGDPVMLAAMQKVMASLVITPPGVATYGGERAEPATPGGVAFSTQMINGPGGAAAGTPAAAPTPTAPAVPVAASTEEALLVAEAGDVYYGVMMSEADSDVGGPVLATIVNGDNAGSTLIGEFQRAGDSLRILFSTLNHPEYGTLSVQAVAVSPTDASVGLATYVNHHYLKRFGGLVLGGFVSGLGKAAAISGQTSTVTAAGAIVTSRDELDTNEELLIAAGTGAEAVGSELEELAATPITVRVAADTPIGVLFLSDAAVAGAAGG